MTADEKDDLLDRYVAGMPLSAEEEKLINQLLATDAAFRTEYRLRQELVDFGKRERRVAWEARQTVRPLPVKPLGFPMRWAAAASIVLLLGAGLLWWGRMSTTELLTGQAVLFEQRDSQLGFAGSDSAAVGTITWVVRRAETDQYEFGGPDTLRIFATDPRPWQVPNWQLIRLSEVRYRLRVGNKTYTLKQGRAVHLPLVPDQ